MNGPNGFVDAGFWNPLMSKSARFVFESPVTFTKNCSASWSRRQLKGAAHLTSPLWNPIGISMRIQSEANASTMNSKSTFKAVGSRLVWELKLSARFFIDKAFWIWRCSYAYSSMTWLEMVVWSTIGRAIRPLNLGVSWNRLLNLIWRRENASRFSIV